MQIKSTMLSLAVAMVTSFFGASCSADDAVVYIAHVGPITGPIAHLGKDNENGARLAIEELNAKGTKIDGKSVRFVLLAEDDGNDPKQGTEVAQKLVDAKVNGVVGNGTSGTSIPAAKIYYDAGIPQIAPSSTAVAYTAMGYKTTFRVVANDGKLGSILGRYAVNNLNAKSIAVIDDRSAYGQGLADEFIKSVKNTNPAFKNIQRQYTDNKATDFNAILTKIKSAKPDLIFFGGMDSTAGPMLRQMKALGINAKFLGGDGICTSNFSDLAGDSLRDNQVYCAEAGGIADEQKAAADNFLAAYKKRFGVDVLIYAPYVYDAVMTLVDAMQQAKSSNPAIYLPYLQNISHKGVTGEIAFDKKGDIKNGALTLYIFKSGRREKIAVLR
jgi:branched-chain amino acid transport system substrate-binding protein